MSSELQNDDISTQISQWQPFKILRNVKRTKKPKKLRRRSSMTDDLLGKKKQQQKKRKASDPNNLNDMGPKSAPIAPIKATFDYQNISLNPSYSQPPSDQDLNPKQKSMPILQHSYSAPPEDLKQNYQYQQYRQQQQEHPNSFQKHNQQQQQSYYNDPFGDDKCVDYFKMDEQMYNGHLYNNMYNNDPCMDGLLDYNGGLDDDLKYCRGLPSPNSKKIINYSEFEDGSLNFQQDESLSSSDCGYNNMCNMFV